MTQFDNLLEGSKNLGRGVEVKYQTNPQFSNPKIRVFVSLFHFGKEMKSEEFKCYFPAYKDGAKIKNNMLKFINESVQDFINKNSDYIYELKHIVSEEVFRIIEQIVKDNNELRDQVKDIRKSLDELKGH